MGLIIFEWPADELVIQFIRELVLITHLGLVWYLL